MDLNIREFVESPIPQGIGESVVYRIDMSPVTASFTSPETLVHDEAGEDITSTVATGTTTQSGNYAITKTIAFTAPGNYWLGIRFVPAGGASTLIHWGKVVVRKHV